VEPGLPSSQRTIDSWVPAIVITADAQSAGNRARWKLFISIDV